MLHLLPLLLAPLAPYQNDQQQEGAPAKSTMAMKLVEKVSAKRLEKTVRDLVSFGTRHVYSSRTDPKRGIGAAAKYLAARLKKAAARSKGRMTVTSEAHKVSNRGRSVEVVNIVATIRGSEDPDRIYVMGGHYDSRNSSGRDATGDAPGANDDASGVAVVLELAELLADVPLRATLRLVCYDGEEVGLLGSTADAKALKEQDAFVDGMLTMDIVGNTEAVDGRRERGYVRVFSYANAEQFNDSTGRNLARVAADCARRYVKDLVAKLIYRGDRYGRGGDHRPFNGQGYPAMRFTEPYENFSRQHKNVIERNGKPYGDLPEFMDFPYLSKVAKLALALAYELTNAPRAPSGVFARGTAELGTTVTLRGADTPIYQTGWEIVWRNSASADWQDSVFVPVSDNGGFRKVLKQVLLDDSIVGVRSVSIDGCRSRVSAVPEPGARRRRRR